MTRDNFDELVVRFESIEWVDTQTVSVTANFYETTETRMIDF